MKQSVYSSYVLIAVLAGSLFLPVNSPAQTLPVGQLGLDETLRSQQLMGQVDGDYSFTVRPLHYSALLKKGSAFEDSMQRGELQSMMPWKSLKENKFVGFAVSPLMLTAKFNSHHPYGWNDEGMLAAKGLQTEVSMGIYGRVGPLSLQLQPQYVYAANPDFYHNAAYGAPTPGPYSKLLPGQSNISINAGPVSFGYSTENLWWGPGQHSALLISNNAPGFEHFTFNSTRPVKTPIGSFEFQLIAGKLDEDSASGLLYENFQLKPAKLTNDWRYLNAVVISYQPKFLPGVFVGMTRAFQLYHTDFTLQSPSLTGKYLPVFSALFKNSTRDEDAKNRDQALSIFTRVVFPKSHAEFYFEYGYNDHSANTRDFVLDPEHSAAYLVGGKKLIELPGNRWLELSGEITQMAQSPDYVVRNAGNWYLHGVIRQGLTHENQILGAGSGIGNNVQTFTASWLSSIKKLGLIIQRIQHDPKALGGGLSTMGLRDYAWNEFAIGVQSRWDLGNWLACFELQHSWSSNYAWEQGKHAGNIYGLLKIAYRW